MVISHLKLRSLASLAKEPRDHPEDTTRKVANQEKEEKEDLREGSTTTNHLEKERSSPASNALASPVATRDHLKAEEVTTGKAAIADHLNREELTISLKAVLLVNTTVVVTEVDATTTLIEMRLWNTSPMA